VGERFEQALAEAAAVQPGGPNGGFAGVPTLIKNNTDIAGLPTLHGSSAVPARPTVADAPFTALVRAAGLLPIATSTLPEFGLTATTEFVVAPPTANPWNTNYSSGGSSGGSAALVAAGVVPMAHANDGGGSIRIPAACCGLVGLKASRGRLPPFPMADSLPIDLVSDGVVTRTVGDTAAFIAEAEQRYAAPGLPAVGRVSGPAEHRLRIGLWQEHPLGDTLDADVARVVGEVAECCRALGHEVHSLPAIIDDQMADDFFLYWSRMAAACQYLGRFVFGRGYDRAGLSPLTRQLSRHYLRNIWHSPSAIRRLRQFAVHYCGLFDRCDLILSPVLASPPVKLGYLSPALDLEVAMERLRHYTPFTPPQNIAGTPAISLPLGTSAQGLPIGVQFASAMGDERSLLEIAFELEARTSWSYG
jgi:amidase